MVLRQLFVRGLLVLSVCINTELHAQFTDFLNEALNTSERPKPEGRAQLGKIFIKQRSDIHLKDSKAFIFSKIRNGESIYEGDTLFVGKTQAQILFDEKYGASEVLIEANSIVSFNSLVQINDVPVIQLEGGSMSISKAPKAPKQALVVRRGKEAYVVTQEKNQLSLSFAQGSKTTDKANQSKSADSISAQPVAFSALVEQSNTVDLIDASKELARVAKARARQKSQTQTDADKAKKKQVSTDLALQSVITANQKDLPELALRKKDLKKKTELPPKKTTPLDTLDTLDSDYSHLNKAAKLPGTPVYDVVETQFDGVDLTPILSQKLTDSAGSGAMDTSGINSKEAGILSTLDEGSESSSANAPEESQKLEAVPETSIVSQNPSDSADEAADINIQVTQIESKEGREDNQVELLDPNSTKDTKRQRGNNFRVLIGGSLLTQNFSNSTNSSTGKSLGLRARIGYQYSKKLSFGLMYIGTLSKISGSANVTPSWMLGTAEYKVFNRQTSDPTYIPHLHLVLGTERYSNNVAEVQNQLSFLNSYISITGGFRSRFDIMPQWQIGGDFLYTYLSNARKLHVQGDLIYQFNENLTLGAGYWLESVSSSAVNLSENSFALELFVETGF